MRFEGLLKSWNSERGFGFIEPSQRGQEIFVHIKAFNPRVETPRLKVALSFEIELDRDGKKRATKVRIIRPVRARNTTLRDAPARWGVASRFALPAFLIVHLGVARSWGVPGVVAAGYLVASLTCFLAYALDKSAARAGRWRTSEEALLLLGLAGGWPGAILAQQLLRHKSSKPSFRKAFWGTVALNIAAFVTLCSPWFASLTQ
ncbi:MAG: cold shock and DUF1294 domain-containing protein [Burkholderiaceae bacterium]